MSDLDSLRKKFDIPQAVEIIAGQGGLTAVRVLPSPSSHGALATVYLHGGHVASWKPQGAGDVLWLSEKSAWDAGKPIRGGVPICFPWFGPRKDASPPPAAPSPPHGFARLFAWSLETIQKSPRGIVITLGLRATAETRAIWPHDFLLRQHITVGEQLELALELTNSGAAAFSAELAQHTYFSVGDVRQARVTGLAGTRYIDKVDGAKEKTQEGDITITGETDRVYLNTTTPMVLDDPVKKRRITVSKQNSAASVVWNPWIAKAKAMADFGDDEWPGMICLETCSVGPHALTLNPGKVHTMTTHISVMEL